MAQADTIRIATYNTELQRDGPGLFLRDLARGGDDQIDAVLAVIAHAGADLLALQSIDYDLTGEALRLFAEAAGYPHQFALRPNTGLPTGLDMDGDGRLGGPRDAQGYGRFSGQGGMAILSRFPIIEDQVQDLSDLLWTALPGALLPEVEGAPFPSPDAQAAQRLSTTGHWIVPVDTPDGPFHLMTFHASPPVFDGPEDRNGKRNHDEIRLWQHVLDETVGTAPPGPFVLAGDANLDPEDGSGLKSAIRNLLADPRLADLSPRGHAGTDTVDWTDPVPGDLRVSYVLPSTHWRVVDSGVLWPSPDDPLAKTVETASRHRLVWADLALDPAGSGE
ncbi:endonuclease/exonuclease/phosphatase family protein [Tateyamaria omphalii]|uniref:endonuclease/exonuclease/phosphatase family protein n=1 Tax=Tateyamaria omphalii TaxID=299262 RepID=UPI001C99EB51|nr:endonuclease/exonuclease/phosphatase family protein [Tateyamaria omphalii]MBY5933770.1 endonuclease/exonuclease/phosphatase family protein [Tateyamaria omphalii]